MTTHHKVTYQYHVTQVGKWLISRRSNKGNTSLILLSTIFVRTYPKTYWWNKENPFMYPHSNDPLLSFAYKYSLTGRQKKFNSVNVRTCVTYSWGPWDMGMIMDNNSPKKKKKIQSVRLPTYNYRWILKLNVKELLIPVTYIKVHDKR